MRYLLLLAALLVANPLLAAEPQAPIAEKFLHRGEFTQGESASYARLETHPADDETRFGLGVIQFVRAIENLGKALYEYGAKSENTNTPFLRFPVPANEHPSTISYRALGRILDSFAYDLSRAEKTLSEIRDENVKLRLRLAKIRFDFAGDSKSSTTLLQLLEKLNRQRFEFMKDNPEFRTHFDRGDVAWLRAYCHLLTAMVESYRAVDEEAGFDERMNGIFPKVEKPRVAQKDWIQGSNIVDAPRLRRARLHMIAVCELNQETWKFIRAEKDDDYEWLPHANQKSVLGLPVDDRRIDGWLVMIGHLEDLFRGKALISSGLLGFLGPTVPGQGLNIKKLLDDPPVDLLNSAERISKKGIDPKYLEREKGRKLIGLEHIMLVAGMFEGPFGFAYAAWFN